MAIDFPSAGLTVGQKFTPIAGLTYTWDGQKWTGPSGAGVGKTPVYNDGSVAMTAALTLSGDPVNPTDAADKHYVDNMPATLGLMKLAGNQTVVGGFGITTYSLGNGAGVVTPNPMNGNYQFITNNGGAFTINPPTVDCAIDLLVWNSTTGGAISMGSGWTYASTNYGDAYDTVSGHVFIFSIRRIAAVATFVIKALQ